MTANLGQCGAYLPAARERCDGWLIVDREDSRIVEASCDKCGAVAGRPKTVLRSSEPEREEAWWQR